MDDDTLSRAPDALPRLEPIELYDPEGRGMAIEVVKAPEWSEISLAYLCSGIDMPHVQVRRDKLVIEARNGTFTYAVIGWSRARAALVLRRMP